MATPSLPKLFCLPDNVKTVMNLSFEDSMARARQMRDFIVTAIVASNPGDFGQGRVGADNTCASRLPCASRSFSCLKRSKHNTNSLDRMLSRAVHWQNRGLPSTIHLMDPNLISKVMQEMGRKGGKKGGKKGAKMRAEALTPEQRSQIARKAAKTRWAKVKKRH